MPSDRDVVLGAYARVQRPADRAVARALSQAATAGQRAIRRHGGGSLLLRDVVLAQVVAELKLQQRTLWGSVSRSVERGVEQTAAAALEAQERLDHAMLERLPRSDLADLLARQREIVRGRVDLYRRGVLGAPIGNLSTRLYYVEAISSGRIERLVRNAIILGKTADELARDVERYIKPSVPGGVSYVAQRLARTEIQNAYHVAQLAAMDDNPAVRAVKWNLVRDHHPDVCDRYAMRPSYPFDKVPDKPHPNCLCFLTPVHVGRRRFPQAVRELLRRAVA